MKNTLSLSKCFLLCFLFFSSEYFWGHTNESVSITDFFYTESEQNANLQSGETSNFKPQIPNVLNPSPEAMKMMRYESQPPSLATGTVATSIPIYDIHVGSFTLPIKLQYATNGIKVADSPFPLGYGWVLSPALRINRIVLGKPDERYTRDFRSATSLTHNVPEDKNDFEYLKGVSINTNSEVPLLDAQYDLFSVSLPNESFKFIIKQSSADQFIAESVGTNARIDIVSKKTGGIIFLEFIITDDQGIKYYFGQTTGNDITNPIEILSLDAISSQSIVTSWALTKIQLPGLHESINFKWKSILKNTCSVDGRSYIMDKRNLTEDQKIACGLQPPFLSRSSYPVGELEPDMYNGRYLTLDEIQYPLGSVKFNYSSSFLSNVEMKTSVAQDIPLLKVVDLSYSGNLLKKLDISGEGSYSFEYNPNRFNYCYGLDFWGFYNGNSNTDGLAPYLRIIDNDNSSSYAGFGKANRNVNLNMQEANILTKITYPTGGSSSFEYEPHDINGRALTSDLIPLEYYKPFGKGGGVRIKKIVDIASDTSPAVVKIYKYGKNESGKGLAVSEPTLNTFMQEKGTYQLFIYTGGSGCPQDKTHVFNGVATVMHPLNNSIIQLSPNSNYQNYLICDIPIWYEEVTEYIGSTKNKYSYVYDTYLSQESPDSGNHFGEFKGVGEIFPSRINTVGIPFLKEKVMYLNQSGIYKPISKQSYIYDMQKLSYKNLKVEQSILTQGEANPNDDSHFSWSFIKEYADILPSGHFYTPFYYDLELAYKYIKKEINTDYIYTNGTDSIVKAVTYNYSGRNNNMLLKQKEVSINTGTLKDEFIYPWENLEALSSVQKAYISNMLSLNRVATPIQYKQSRNNNIIANKIVQYKDYGNNLILPEVEYYSTKNDQGEARVKYNNYDNYGNPLFITKDNVTNISYLWSYKGQYPIAEIQNTTYQDIKTAINTNPESFSASITPNMSLISTLKSNANLKNAQVSSYTYKPLVGLLEYTNPMGMVTDYEYDSFGRLLNIYENRNNQKQLIKSFDYNVKNNPDYTISMDVQPNTGIWIRVGDGISFQAQSSGGSGYYTYKWIAYRGSDSEIIQTVNNQTGYFSVTFDEDGIPACYVRCIVTDQFTGKTSMQLITVTVLGPDDDPPY